MVIMNCGLTVIDSRKQASTKSVWIITEVVRNLKACFTVPSIFSWFIAVGTYESKLNRSCRSYMWTRDPVNILQTRILVTNSVP